MLSYRHSFHAGNHADLLKHLALLGLLRHLAHKDKPFTYLDSHAGAGRYDLKSPQASHLEEAQTGIGRLWNRQFPDPLLDGYLQQVREFNPDGQLRFYPGSPALALQRLRPNDRAILMELHSSEFPILRDNCRGDHRVALHRRDAYEGLLALTPPSPQRGLALIDPSYEVGGDYQQALDTLVGVHRKWPVGVLALWYPVLAHARDQSPWLKRNLKKADLASLLCVELVVRPRRGETGMQGSGMLIVNAPWQFEIQLQESLGQIAPLLCEPGASGVQIEWLTHKE